jgi:hypothetical protein
MLFKFITIFFLAVFFVMPVLVLACDYDGACESGETKDNCIFDCFVATNNKEVKIGACNYNISKITKYDISGNPTIITDSATIFNFIGNKNYIDLIDGDETADYVSIKKLSDNVSDIPIIIYWWGLGLQPYYCKYPNINEYPICQSAENGTHEDWFLHQYGSESIKDNRIQRSYCEGYIWDNSNANWRNAFSDTIQSYHNANPNIDGMFLDETQVRMNTSLLVINHTEEQAVQEGIGNYGKPFKYITPTIPLSDPDVTVKNKDNPSIQYAVSPWVQMNTVYFIDNSIPNGTIVIVKYSIQATADPNVLNNWEANYTSLLQQIRQKNSDKLIIFNGFYGNYNHDSFFQYADGGMKEGIFGYNISESSWKEELDQLVSYSSRKIHYAFSSSNFPTVAPQDQIQKHALFAFTSFLLGKGKYAYFQYAPSCQHFYFFDYWQTPLGQPSELYHLKGNFSGANIYEREYEKALVLVNPSETNSGTINLGSAYKTLTGSLVSSVSLSSKEGILLQKILFSTCSLPGDINGDNQVNSSDLTIAVNLFFNIETASSQTCPSQADLNSDGQTDISDIQKIINLML